MIQKNSFKTGSSFRSSFAHLLLLCLFLLFPGCFETEFDYKTVIYPDGAVYRETRIEGRGANLFMVPSGAGWETKSWETKGNQAILPDTVYHVLAQGKFLPGQNIPPDYQLNVQKQVESWGEQEKKKLESAGITAPYESSLYSRNKINVHKTSGFLTDSYVYEEEFQTAGLIQVLLLDLKEEIKKKNQLRGISLGGSEIESLARLRLEDEFLSLFEFESEILMPGKIVFSNADRVDKGKAFWKFSTKDFEENYSIFTLKATSRSLNLSGVIFLTGAGILAFFLLILAGVGTKKIFKAKPSRTKKPDVS